MFGQKIFPDGWHIIFPIETLNHHIMKSLIESIQKSLGYQPLQKMDPNTQDVKTDEKNLALRSLPQAAIPAMTCGLLNGLQSKEGAEIILHDENADWLEAIFGKKAVELVSRVANYSGTSLEYTRQEIIHIANEAIRLIREANDKTVDQQSIHQYASQQKNETLLYLPAALHLGDLINNNPMDDRTHQMEGPISSIMHSIENKFN
jgi:hypothetical protein